MQQLETLGNYAEYIKKIPIGYVHNSLHLYNFQNMIHFRNEGLVSCCQNLEMKVGCEEISGF